MSLLPKKETYPKRALVVTELLIEDKAAEKDWYKRLSMEGIPREQIKAVKKTGSAGWPERSGRRIAIQLMDAPVSEVKEVPPPEPPPPKIVTPGNKIVVVPG